MRAPPQPSTASLSFLAEQRAEPAAGQAACCQRSQPIPSVCTAPMAPQSRLAALAALLVLALAAAGLQPAAARRGLAQAAAAAAGDGAPAPAGAPAAEAASPAVEASDGQQSIYGSPQVDYCIELTNKAGQACTVESDTCECLGRPGSCAVQLPPQSY